jgi:hypothetical protein
LGLSKPTRRRQGFLGNSMEIVLAAQHTRWNATGGGAHSQSHQGQNHTVSRRRPPGSR